MLKTLKTWAYLSLGVSFAAAIASGTAYAGGYTCVFTSCYEETGCNDKKFAEKNEEDSGRNRPEMVLPGVTVIATKQVDEKPGIVSGTVSYVSDLELNNVRLLTIYSNGSARLSSHSFLSDAFSIESRGHCEAN